MTSEGLVGQLAVVAHRDPQHACHHVASEADAQGIPAEGEGAPNEGSCMHRREEGQIPHVCIGERPSTEEVRALLLHLPGNG